MRGRMQEKMFSTVAALLLCAVTAGATEAHDGQYERVADNRYCNFAGECYTKEYLPSGVVRYCRVGGGCRYLSTPQNIVCPQGYMLTGSGACQALQPSPIPPPQHQRQNHHARRNDHRRQSHQRNSRY